MKHKFGLMGRVAIALVLALSLCLVTAVPVAANTDRLVPDPYTTIQAAIDAAEPGDTIIVSDGTYAEDLKIENKTGITLRSENGKDVTTIQLTGVQKYGIEFVTGNSDITIGGEDGHGFTILGAVTASAGNFVISLNNCPSGVEISYNEIDTTGVASIGINIGAGGATGLIVDNNIFTADEGDEYQDWPISASAGTGVITDLVVTDNEFTGSGTPNKYGAAIDLVDVQIVSLTKSVIANNTISDFDRGIILGTDDNNTSNVAISGNTISGCTQGIKLTEGTDGVLENVTLNGNTLTNNAIQVFDEAEVLVIGDVLPPNNTFDCAVTVEHEDALLYTIWSKIQDGADNALAGDTIIASDGTYAEDLKIENKTGITLRSENGRDVTTITTIAKPGIEIQGTADGFTLGGADGEGFTINGTAGHLIVLANAPSGIEISYNTIDTTGLASQGISVGADGATGLTVSNNILIADEVSGCQDVPISLNGQVTDLTVADNKFTGPGVHGYSGAAIDIDIGMSGGTITNNTITGFDRGIMNGTDDPGEFVDTLLVSHNDISGCGKAILLRGNVDMATVTIEYNNLSGNTQYGLENGCTEVVNATNNYWGHASGPIGPAGVYTSYGDAVSTKVDYEPWLLEEQEKAATYDKTLALKKGWTLVSTNKAVDATASGWVGLAGTELDSVFKYALVWGSATTGDLEPVDVLCVKTVDGGGVGIKYADSQAGVSSKGLLAGWNLISSGTEALAYDVLSPLPFAGIGGEQPVGMTTLVSQGDYNQFSSGFYQATLQETDWAKLQTKTLVPFDGYWIQMNAPSSFGVITD